jgi:hypothetical protein
MLTGDWAVSSRRKLVLDDSTWLPAVRGAELQSCFTAAPTPALPRNRRALDVFVAARQSRKMPWSDAYERSVRPVLDEHAAAALAASLDEPETELPDLTRQSHRGGEGMYSAKVGCSLRRAAEIMQRSLYVRVYRLFFLSLTLFLALKDGRVRRS